MFNTISLKIDDGQYNGLLLLTSEGISFIKSDDLVLDWARALSIISSNKSSNLGFAVLMLDPITEKFLENHPIYEIKRLVGDDGKPSFSNDNDLHAIPVVVKRDLNLNAIDYFKYVNDKLQERCDTTEKNETEMPTPLGDEYKFSMN